MNDLPAPERLAHDLRELRKNAGNPSYTVIAVWGGQQEPPVRLGKSKLSLWFSGKSVPTDDRLDGRPFTTLVDLLEANPLQKSGTPKQGATAWQERRRAAERVKQGKRRADSSGDDRSAADNGGTLQRLADEGLPAYESLHQESEQAATSGKMSEVDPRLRRAIRNVFGRLHDFTLQGSPQVYVGVIRDDWLGEDSDLAGLVIRHLEREELITQSTKPMCLTYVPGMKNYELAEKGKDFFGDPVSLPKRREQLFADCRDFVERCHVLQDDFGVQVRSIFNNNVGYGVDLSEVTATGRSWRDVDMDLNEVERSARRIGTVDGVLFDGARSVHRSLMVEVEAIKKAGTDPGNRHTYHAAWQEARERSDRLRDEFTASVRARTCLS
ncbi:hypothetical protein [Streptomyces iconiensis]|uniref:Uncharacterized protein n=1 Tax=Streptomyces iconiensis TaxID=1384038 RepID=A0ABT6ZPT0_9ACTN|nr:hypothetical protein [Streptomyces iconiensis]MDJ1130809.1 hypothetical protein [Streptomyces iconiensis]